MYEPLKSLQMVRESRLLCHVKDYSSDFPYPARNRSDVRGRDEQ